MLLDLPIPHSLKNAFLGKKAPDPEWQLLLLSLLYLA